MITDNLTNTVFLSYYLEKECPMLYKNLVRVIKANGVSCRTLHYTNDFWCRDYMPIQVSEKRFVYYKYTPDYLRKKKSYAKYITDPKKVTNVSFPHDAEFVDLDLVIDGGNVVKCGNKIVMTEKVFTENKDKDESKVLRKLEDAFQCEVVMLPWDKEETYGHSDGIIHYAGNNRVIMTNYADFDPRLDKEFRDILSEAGFEIISLN
ncbi:MAG: agmatine deiminase family protein, partial [Bacteroidales bacterium]|nr:agmatine deiminase family protein [Bacteroidales bacterium]